MSSQFSKIAKSSRTEEYGTPLEMYQKLNKIFKFKIDPATTPDNPLRTEVFYTKEQDGLKKEWNRNTFINPPFGKKDKKNGKETDITNWIYHMYSQATIHENKKYVMLLPARTDTKWFQEMILTDFKDDSVIYFVKGRQKFINPEYNAKQEPHVIGTMFWIMNSNKKELYELKQSIQGILLHDWDNNGVRTD